METLEGLAPQLVPLANAASKVGVSVTVRPYWVEVSRGAKIMDVYLAEDGSLPPKRQRKLIAAMQRMGGQLQWQLIPDELQSESLARLFGRREAPPRGPTTCPNPGKRRFNNRITAELEIERIAIRKGASREITPCRSYRCSCGNWHLTHQPLRR